MNWRKQFDKKFTLMSPYNGLGRFVKHSEPKDLKTFISKVEADAIRRSDKVYKDKMEKAVKDTIEMCAKEIDEPNTHAVLLGVFFNGYTLGSLGKKISKKTNTSALLDKAKFEISRDIRNLKS